ncbi:PAS domain S-box-containing protein [Caldalkalibacillus uzonensis]|uniref:PAS domain S-box-containing protein n=1 Tax=Caldalkalibacillus uzonensis TaxID=353224 RepID=A0ABU0CQF8_9BACI|nr:sigma 54-interacting transcriptional regulator [Caldalkalibacillus uzonensis]MDQ0338134.1 PAS domain S-box-containing protein [Caldalkalibacillus uzonensis]
MSSYKILLVTKDQRGRTYKVFAQQLHDYFQNSIELLNDFDGNYESVADLILASSPEVIKGRELPQDKLVVARRTINIKKLKELVALPAGTKCLVVNNMIETARETINILRNLGFDLDMIPYSPRNKRTMREIQEIHDVKVAITPAGLELVPPGIEQVIDIGIRPIDFSTIVEIGVRLNLDVEEANIYVAEIVQLSRGLFNTLTYVNQLNHQLDAILNMVNDGIVATDDKGHIIQVNKAARHILDVHLSDKQMIGKPVQEVFPKLKIFDKSKKNQENTLYSTGGKHLVFNKRQIEIGQGKQGVMTVFQDVTKIQKLEQDLRKELQEKGLSAQYSLKHIIGKSKPLEETIKILKKIAKTDRTVLIVGESGTGKELFAHSIHNLSNRRNGPFLPVNFAGLPESLAESELFGYEDGAFTGAKKGGKPGLFELAHNGTIFLDEIGDASPSLQALLLRVLQEQQVMRVGGHRVIPVNVRVIAATNQNLKEMVEQGWFRKDLYYRLFVLPLRVPPLRERKEDIPLLIDHFIKEYCSTQVHLEQDVMDKLINYNWPGNIRELISVVQYMTSVMEGNQITTNDLPEQFKEISDHIDFSEEQYIQLLEKEGDLIDFYIVLSCLKQAKQNRVGVGRGKIVHYSRKAGFPLTDQQVRRRMEILRELGLIHSGTRGQGSRITTIGSLILDVIKTKLEHISASCQT